MYWNAGPNCQTRYPELLESGANFSFLFRSWQGEQASKQAGQDSIEEGEEKASYPLNITESFFPGLLQILSNVLQRLLYVFDGFVGDGQSVP